MTKALLALIIGLCATTALAQQVTLTSTITILEAKPAPDGKPVNRPPNRVAPGDKLSVALEWANRSAKPADHFAVTDPIPNGLTYADNASSGAQVSVDAGKTFGPLSALRVTDAKGNSRAAVGADVTHVRWTFARPIAPGQHGQLSFEAFVKL